MAMIEVAMLYVENRMDIIAAILAIESMPGKERNVTDALKTIAAFSSY
jgi:hypothetical protein